MKKGDAVLLYVHLRVALLHHKFTNSAITDSVLHWISVYEHSLEIKYIR